MSLAAGTATPGGQVASYDPYQGIRISLSEALAPIARVTNPCGSSIGAVQMSQKNAGTSKAPAFYFFSCFSELVFFDDGELLEFLHFGGEDFLDRRFFVLFQFVVH